MARHLDYVTIDKIQLSERTDRFRETIAAMLVTVATKATALKRRLSNAWCLENASDGQTRQPDILTDVRTEDGLMDYICVTSSESVMNNNRFGIDFLILVCPAVGGTCLKFDNKLAAPEHTHTHARARAHTHTRRRSRTYTFSLSLRHRHTHTYTQRHREREREREIQERRPC